MKITLRSEQTADIDTIAHLTEVAFLTEPHSNHTEQFIIKALRRARQLTVSLVALDGEEIVGHVAISPVTLSSGATDWYGLGPISVWPRCQGQGIGHQLMHAALAELQRLGGQGCVLVGNPAFYQRFGFRPCPDLVLPGIPQQYFMALAFAADLPAGEVQFHPAFNAIE